LISLDRFDGTSDRRIRLAIADHGSRFCSR
jgi:hypothetical protein